MRRDDVDLVIALLSTRQHQGADHSGSFKVDPWFPDVVQPTLLVIARRGRLAGYRVLARLAPSEEMGLADGCEHR